MTFAIIDFNSRHLL